MAGPAAPAAVQLQLLRNENDLLRSQLANMTKREGDLRVQLAERERESAKARSRASELEALLGEHRDAANAQARQAIDKLMRDNQRFRANLNQSTDVQGVQEAIIDELEAAVATLTSTVSATSKDMEEFQRMLLPNFAADTAEAEASFFSSESERDRRWLVPLHMLQHNYSVLKKVVDAKDEAAALVKARLKKEIQSLRDQIHKTKGAQSMVATSMQQREFDFDQERSAMRDELRRLKELYEGELAKTRKELARCKEQMASATGKASKLAERNSSAERRADELAERAATLTQKYEEEEAARIRLAAELSSTRRALQERELQLDQLKLSQKYLGAGTAGGAVPEDKMNVMRVADRLLRQVETLKEENLQLKGQCQDLRRKQITAKLDCGPVSDKELDLIADGKVSDLDLTARILRKKMSTTPREPHLSSVGDVLLRSPANAAADPLKRQGWAPAKHSPYPVPGQ